MSNGTETIAELLNAAMRAGARNLYTCLPAKVVKWDAAKQRAHCQPLIKDAYEDETGERQVESLPVIPGVPVQFMGAGGYRLTFPIELGTTGTLFFAHRSMDKWLSGDGKEVDPEFDQDHGLGDAIFMPGLKPFGAPWESCPTDHMTLGADGGVQAHFYEDRIALGDESGNQYVALAQKVQDWFDAFNTAVNGWVVAPNDGGAALKTALSTLIGGTPSTNVAASQVKAK